MPILPIPIKLLVILVMLVLLLGCPFQKKEEWHPLGPQVRASLVVYFKIGVTEKEVNKFWEEILSKPDPQGRGFYHKDGVGPILRVYPSVQGHEAIAVTFMADATQAQREEVKAAVKSSPIVYKVLEDIVPAEVKSID